MEKYTIHGNPFFYDGKECGIYKPRETIGVIYGSIIITDIIDLINKRPIDAAVRMVTLMGSMAEEQLNLEGTLNSSLMPKDKVKIDNIRNTKELSDKLLEALKAA